MKVSNALAGMVEGKNDMLVNILAQILTAWMATDKSLWAKCVETAYQYTKNSGTTIGVFSNLLAKLGMSVDELPFMQLEVERIKNPLMGRSLIWEEFGLKSYFGDAYESIATLVVPFLTCANVLLKDKNGYWAAVDTGDVYKGEPLVLTFISKRSKIKLALYGHILLRESMIMSSFKRKRVEINLPMEKYLLVVPGDSGQLGKLTQAINEKVGEPVYGIGEKALLLGRIAEANIVDNEVFVGIDFINSLVADSGIWQIDLSAKVVLSEEGSYKSGKQNKERKPTTTLNISLYHD